MIGMIIIGIIGIIAISIVSTVPTVGTASSPAAYRRRSPPYIRVRGMRMQAA